MKFHPDKSHVLIITRKKEPIHFNYVLHGHKLEHVQTAKYLGVTISHDMRWNTHMDNIVKKKQALGTKSQCALGKIVSVVLAELSLR